MDILYGDLIMETLEVFGETVRLILAMDFIILEAIMGMLLQHSIPILLGVMDLQMMLTFLIVVH
jgi:hypothetical protein